jgi:hypothetical protein
MSELSEWLAKTMRGERNSTALVIQGGRGSGKGVAVRMIEAALPGKKVATFPCDSRAIAFDVFPRMITGTDITVMDEVHTWEHVERAKNALTAEFLEVERKGSPADMRPVRANLILLANQYFPRNEENRRFIVASPIEVIAEMIPHLAK